MPSAFASFTVEPVAFSNRFKISKRCLSCVFSDREIVVSSAYCVILICFIPWWNNPEMFFAFSYFHSESFRQHRVKYGGHGTPLPNSSC